MSSKRPVKRASELNVWQKAHQLVTGIYHMIRHFPEKEIPALAPSIRRPGISILSNLAEALEHEKVADKLWYLSGSKSALMETRYYLALADRHAHCNSSELIVQAEQMSMLLELYIKSLKK